MIYNICYKTLHGFGEMELFGPRFLTENNRIWDIQGLQSKAAIGSCPFEPRGKGPAALCSLKLFKNILLPHSPARKASGWPWQTIPPLTPSWGILGKGRKLPPLSYLESQITGMCRDTSHPRVCFLKILKIITKTSNLLINS